MHHILKTGFNSKLDVTNIIYMLFLFSDYNIYTQTFRHSDLQMDKMLVHLFKLKMLIFPLYLIRFS